MKRKTIHFFRHAEATHNLPITHPDFSMARDTPLTTKGIWQARNLLATPCAANFKNPTLIISSPSQRTLETTMYAFDPRYNPDLLSSILTGTEFPECKLTPRQLRKVFGCGEIKFLADPRITEVCTCEDTFGLNKPICMEDQRSTFLKTFTFPPELFLPGQMQDWVMRDGFYDDQVGSPMAEARCRSFLKFLLERPEEEIIVVSHQGFLVNYLLYPFEITRIDNANGVTVDFIWRKGYEKPEAKLRREEKGVKGMKMWFIRSMQRLWVKMNKKEGLPGIDSRQTENTDSSVNEVGCM